jgi:hypothetical protein
MPYQYVDDGTSTQVTPPVQQETAQQQYERLYPSANGTSTTQQQQVIKAEIPQELTQELRTLRAEIAALKATPKEPEVKEDPVSDIAWVEEIKKGNYAGAQKVIVSETLKHIKPQFDEELRQTRDRAYQQALEATQVQLEIDKHVREVRTANPDLAQFEKYLQGPVAQRVEIAKQAGKIQTPQDFVREYNQAIDAEVGEVRKLGLVLRGQAAQNATTRQMEVQQASVLSPNQVQLGTPQAATGEQNAESTDDYFARRRAQEYRNRGLTQG